MQAEADNELIRRFQGGDTIAFDIFVRRHQDRVYRLAAVLVKSRADAADVTQDVFLRALSGLKRFGFRSEPFTWLYATTKNVCREYNRRDRGVTELNVDSADPRPSAGETMDSDLAVRTVRKMVSGLPERQRDVVLLRVFEELSVEQTARVLGCRPGTVKAQLHKAIKGLKRSVAGVPAGEYQCPIS